jgi:hypothetical protein
MERHMYHDAAGVAAGLSTRARWDRNPYDTPNDESLTQLVETGLLSHGMWVQFLQDSPNDAG